MIILTLSMYLSSDRSYVRANQKIQYNSAYRIIWCSYMFPPGWDVGPSWVPAHFLIIILNFVITIISICIIIIIIIIIIIVIITSIIIIIILVPEGYPRIKDTWLCIEIVPLSVYQKSQLCHSWAIQFVVVQTRGNLGSFL